MSSKYTSRHHGWYAAQVPHGTTYVVLTLSSLIRPVWPSAYEEIVSLSQKKIHNVIYLKKKLHDLPRKKMTRCDDFSNTRLPQKLKNLQDVTAKKQLPILRKMHARRRCAHLWATSDFFAALGVGDPRECTGDIALPLSSGPLEGRGEVTTSDPHLQ